MAFETKQISRMERNLKTRDNIKSIALYLYSFKYLNHKDDKIKLFGWKRKICLRCLISICTRSVEVWYENYLKKEHYP